MSSKPALLLLHGALGASSQFEQLTNILNSSFTIHTLNFSGHGGQSFTEDFSIEQFAKELQTYIEKNHLHNVDVFGYSMGGYVALYLAQSHPNLVNRIYTLGTKFSWSPETAAKEVKMLNPEKIEEKVPAFAKALAERHAPNEWKKVLYRTKDMMLALGEQPALTDSDFAQIKQSVAIGIGSEDNMVSFEESENAANLLPNGSVYIFNEFKHPIEQVDYKKLADELIGFFG